MPDKIKSSRCPSFSYDNFDNSCKKVKAKSHKKVSYGCKGKYKGARLYKIGDSCGVCPEEYKRNPVQKKAGPKACFLPFGGGESKFTPMKKVMASRCANGQFKHKGRCKSCPNGTKRKHVAGLDTGYCKVLGYKKRKK